MPSNINMVSLILSGGITMVVLVICSFISTWFIVDRLIVFGKAKKVKVTDLALAVKERIKAKRLAEAEQLCRSANTPAGRVFLAGLATFKLNKAGADLAMERQGELEADLLEDKLTTIGTLGNVAPFIGLFGTVLGVIVSFLNYEAASASGSMTGVYAGIGQALITTAAGLFVAVPSVVAYNYFNSFTAKMFKQIEEGSNDILEILRVKKG